MLGTAVAVLTIVQQKHPAEILTYAVFVDGCNIEHVAAIAVTNNTFHIQVDWLTNAVVPLLYKMVVEVLRLTKIVRL